VEKAKTGFWRKDAVWASKSSSPVSFCNHSRNAGSSLILLESTGEASSMGYQQKCRHHASLAAVVGTLIGIAMTD
jgi:hypothetical protein